MAIGSFVTQKGPGTGERKAQRRQRLTEPSFLASIVVGADARGDVPRHSHGAASVGLC